MGKSIALVELKSIPVGIATADEMVKAAKVELLIATPVCPGKYIIVVSGNVGSVESSMKTGVETAGSFLIGNYIINNVHEMIPSALSGTVEIETIQAIGAIETITAMTSIMAGDTAVKASNIKLIEIRIAKGLGGKGFLIFTGDVASVQSAMRACESQLKEGGEIISSCVIPSPNKELISKLF